MSGETILKERDGGLLILTLNRPDEANALNYELAKDFYETMVECSNDKSVRSVLLTGKCSRHFLALSRIGLATRGVLRGSMR